MSRLLRLTLAPTILLIIALALPSINGNAAVTLLAFEAERVDDTTVQVYWETATEQDTVHFNVWRSDPFNPAGASIASEPAQGSFVSGAQYIITDETADPNVTYTYRLEEIEGSGGSSFIGEVEVPAVGASTNTATATTEATTATATVEATNTPTATTAPATSTPTTAATATTRPTATYTPQPPPTRRAATNTNRNPTATFTPRPRNTPRQRNSQPTPTPISRATNPPQPASTPVAQAEAPPETVDNAAENVNPTATEITVVSVETPPTNTPIVIAVAEQPAEGAAPGSDAAMVVFPTPESALTDNSGGPTTLLLVIGLVALVAAAALGLYAVRVLRQH